MTANWVQLSHIASHSLRTGEGGVVLFLDGRIADNSNPVAFPLSSSVLIEDPTPKKIRRAWWGLRKCRCLRRGEPVAYAIPGEGGLFRVGFGNVREKAPREVPGLFVVGGVA